MQNTKIQILQCVCSVDAVPILSLCLCTMTVCLLHLKFWDVCVYEAECVFESLWAAGSHPAAVRGLCLRAS